MSEANDEARTTMYQRFDVHQRLQHFLIIVSFSLLAFSGLPIRYASSAISAKIVGLFGSFDNMLTFHLINGGIMLATALYHLIYVFVMAIKKGKLEFTAYPNKSDIKNIIANTKYLLGKSDVRPNWDRFAFKEKFDYLAVFWGMFIIGGSGVFMWFPDWGANLFPRYVIDMWRLGHSDEAVLAVVVIVVWHFFNVHFNPDIFPFNKVFWNGMMSEEVMAHEHPAELDRLKGNNTPKKTEEGYKPWLSKNTPNQNG